MTLTFWDLALYAGGVFVLFITPGPVWMAIIARTLQGGVRAASPLALGVVVGDMMWPALAIFGVSWAVALFAELQIALKVVAVAMFLWLGVQAIRHAGRPVDSDSRLMRKGFWPGFAAGVAIILGNPKAILFYMGLLQGFFDLTQLNGWDVAAIVVVSQLVPLAGNLGLAALVARLRGFLASPDALRRTNMLSGALLIAVAAIIPFT